MARQVPEWVGKTDDTAIPPRVKLRVFDRQGGFCAECGRKLGIAGERIDYDHKVALINGGANAESNIQALCPWCHTPKTAQDVATKSRNNRKKAKHLGLNKPKRKMPYRRFDGTPVYPGDDR